MNEAQLKAEIVLQAEGFLNKKNINVKNLIETYADQKAFSYFREYINSSIEEKLKQLLERIYEFKKIYTNYGILLEDENFIDEIKTLKNIDEIIILAKLYYRGYIQNKRPTIGLVKLKEIELLIELDEIIENINEKTTEWTIHRGKFTGNPIEKRKNSNYKKYQRVAKFIAIFQVYLPFIVGTQRKACDLAGVNEASFSSWKNKKQNFDKFLEWQNIESISENEIEEIKNEIRNRLGITGFF